MRNEPFCRGAAKSNNYIFECRLTGKCVVKAFSPSLDERPSEPIYSHQLPKVVLGLIEQHVLKYFIIFAQLVKFSNLH